MKVSRRHFLASVTVLPAFSLSGCTVTFKDVQGYVGTVRVFIDKLAIVAATIDPGKKQQVENIQQQIDQAADAFAKLPPDTAGSSDTAKASAALIVALANDALTIAEAIPALPPQTKAILSAVQLLLVTISMFFHIPAAPQLAVQGGGGIGVSALREMGGSVQQTSPTGTASPRLLHEAVSRYNHARDKDRAAEEAQSEIRDWLISN